MASKATRLALGPAVAPIRVMRLGIVGLFLVACGSDPGTQFVISAPDGPTNIARLEVVLASPDDIKPVNRQRLAPNNAVDEETVRYYRQRAGAGAFFEVDDIDGFTFRIEPNLDITPVEKFIPFFIAYDGSDKVIGVGTVYDANEPVAVEIDSEMTRQYPVVMTALEPMNPEARMAEGQSHVVRCGDVDDEWTSGIAWRPGATQLRLLFTPPDADDALTRTTDLDCDTYVAPEKDCDDLRGRFHNGHAEACDLEDSNCDGLQKIPQVCDASACGGVRLCQDGTMELYPCVSAACITCSLSFHASTNPGSSAPCSPSAGLLKLLQCTETSPCDSVAVATTTPDTFEVGLAVTEAGPYVTSIGVVSNTEAYVQARLINAAEVAGVAGDEVGKVILVVKKGLVLSNVTVNLSLGNLVTECIVQPSNQATLMACM